MYPINDNEGALFEFEFASLEDPCESMRHQVYSFNRELIMLFAKQHGFDTNDININVDPNYKDEDDCIGVINERYLLQPYRFKSNFSDQEYHIITCQGFVDKAIEDTAQDITNRLWFDTIIMRRDVEFIRIINQLVKELSHVFIMDNLLIDDFWNEESGENYLKSFRIPEIDDYFDVNIGGVLGTPEAEYVMDSLFNSSIDTEVQPITIESYVKSFTEMLTDVFTE